MARSASTPLASLTASRSRSFIPMLLEMSAESFRHGRQSDMKEKRTGKSSVKPGTDWKRLGSLSDRQIRRSLERDTEARPTDAAFWKKARVVIPAARSEEHTSELQ